jgi:hypothetical protein
MNIFDITLTHSLKKEFSAVIASEDVRRTRILNIFKSVSTTVSADSDLKGRNREKLLTLSR